MITLITNLDYASIGRVRCNVAAVIIEPPDEDSVLGRKTVVIRGFGPDKAWPVFDVRLDTEDPSFEMVDTQSTAIFIGENEDGSSKEPRPLFTGGLLRFVDGTELHLVKGSYDDRPIDFSEHLGASDRYESLWRALEQKTAQYHDAPNMPMLMWKPAAIVRALRGVSQAV